jgi:hypothetical protein
MPVCLWAALNAPSCYNVKFCDDALPLPKPCFEQEQEAALQVVLTRCAVGAMVMQT